MINIVYGINLFLFLQVMAIFGHAQIGVQTNEGGVLSTIPSVQIASTTINPCSSAIAD